MRYAAVVARASDIGASSLADRVASEIDMGLFADSVGIKASSAARVSGRVYSLICEDPANRVRLHRCYTLNSLASG